MKKKIALASLSITGTIVGVGFASGREVYSFFAKFGYISIAFCLLAGFLFGLFCYLIFYFQSSDRSRVFDFVLFVCQLAIASAMFAGLKSVFSKMNISANAIYAMQLALLVFCFLYLMLSKKGVYYANLVISVLMFAVTIFIFVSLIIKNNPSTYKGQLSVSTFILPVLYVGMNIFTAFPLIDEMGRELKDKKSKILSSILIGLFVFFSLSIVCAIILLFGKNFLSSDMIMVDMAKIASVEIIYTILLITSIVTTLLSTIYGGTKFLKKWDKRVSIIFCLSVSLFISTFGFAGIVDKIYPAMGVVCIISILGKILMSKKQNFCKD